MTTRSIAEAVFTSQLLPEMRAHNLDIDNIAEYLHQRAHQPIPNKTTEAKQFMQPLISRIVGFLRGLTPPAGEGTALRNSSNRQIDCTNKKANCSELVTNSRTTALYSHLQTLEQYLPLPPLLTPPFP